MRPAAHDHADRASAALLDWRIDAEGSWPAMCRARRKHRGRLVSVNRGWIWVMDSSPRCALLWESEGSGETIVA
jgi:hypothetical protein